MKTWDILCIRNYSKYNEQINPSSFESTVSILFHTVSRHLGHSWLNTPQKRNYKERLETNSKNIFSKTKTVNLETKDQHKIKIGNILYPEFGNELLNTWNESPKKNRNGLGDLKQFHQAPILHVWGLLFELRRHMEIRNKLFQKISLNKIT